MLTTSPLGGAYLNLNLDHCATSTIAATAPRTATGAQHSMRGPSGEPSTIRWQRQWRVTISPRIRAAFCSAMSACALASRPRSAVALASGAALAFFGAAIDQS